MTTYTRDGLAEAVAELHPEAAAWLFDVVDELTGDLDALELLRQVWPGAGLDLAAWRPSCPPPGLSWAEYESWLAARAG